MTAIARVVRRVSTCQPTSSRWSVSPSTVVGCAVPSKASHSACLMRSRFDEAGVRPRVAALERVGRLVRVRVEAEAVHQRPRPAALAVPRAERAQEAHRRRRDVVLRLRMVVAARRQADADHRDRRIDALQRVVRRGEVRPEGARRHVLAGRVELRPPERGLVRLVADDEVPHLAGRSRRARRRTRRRATATRAPPRSRAADTGRRRARREARLPCALAIARSSSGLSWMTTASLGTKRTPITVCRRPSAAISRVQRRATVVRVLRGVVVRADIRGNADGRSSTGAPRRAAVAVARIRIRIHPAAGSPLPAATCEPRGERGSRQADAARRSGRDRRPAGRSPRRRRRSRARASSSSRCARC